MTPHDTNIRNEFIASWSIENFVYCIQKTSEALQSPMFTVDSLDKTLWFFEFYPKGKADEKFVTLYLMRDASCNGPDIFPLSFELSLTFNGKTLNSRKKEFDFRKKSGWGFGCIGVKRLLVISRDTEQSSGDASVTVCCRMRKKNAELPKIGYCFMRSRIGVQRCSFLWEIEKFAKYKLGEMKCSNVQLWATNDDPHVTFDSFISVDTYDREKLNLQLEFEPRGSLLTIFEMGLVNANGIIVHIQKDERWANPDERKILFLSFIDRKILLEKKERYLPNDTLTLQCNFIFSKGIVYENVEKISYGRQCLNVVSRQGLMSTPKDTETVSIPTRPLKRDLLHLYGESSSCNKKLRTSSENAEKTSYGRQCLNVVSHQGLMSTPEDTEMVSVPTRTLKRDLLRLYEESSSCVKKLRTYSEVFPVHSIILSARSPVFKRMFVSSMRESSGDEVFISDLEDDTVRRMLLFLYADKLEDDVTVEIAKKLFYAADKYEIEFLKSACGSFLTENMSVGNVCELLLLADKHHDEKMKSAATEFVLGNCKKVMCTEQWSAFMKDSLQMAAEIMRLYWLR